MWIHAHLCIFVLKEILFIDHSANKFEVQQKPWQNFGLSGEMRESHGPCGNRIGWESSSEKWCWQSALIGSIFHVCLTEKLSKQLFPLCSEGVKYLRAPGTHHVQPSLGTFFCQYCDSFFLPVGVRQRACKLYIYRKNESWCCILKV